MDAIAAANSVLCEGADGFFDGTFGIEAGLRTTMCRS